MRTHYRVRFRVPKGELITNSKPHAPREYFAIFVRNAKCLGWLLPLVGFIGCQAQRPDVNEELTRLTALENAIVFRENAEPQAVLAEGAASQAKSLSLSDAVRSTLLHDPRLQSAIAKVRVAEADANQARLLPNPILNIDFRFPTQPGSNKVFEGTLSADLISLLQKPGLIAAADKRLRISACDALTVTLDIINEVQVSYAAVQATDAQVDTARLRIRMLGQLRDMTQKRLQENEGTRLDVLTLEAQNMQATFDAADLHEISRQERLHLARLIGEPRASAEWVLSAIEVPVEELAPESEWIDAALRNRPEICSHAWELRALGDDLSAAAFSPFVGGSVGAHSEKDPQWRVGPNVTLPLPIFDFGQASRGKIKALRIAARHALAEQQFEVIQDIRTAYAAYLHARATLAAIQANLLPVQQQLLDQAQRAYQAGETDLTTLIIAETENQLTLSKSIVLQQNLVVARLKLQRACGGAAIAQQMIQPATQPTPPAILPTSRPATGPAL